MGDYFFNLLFLNSFIFELIFKWNNTTELMSVFFLIYIYI